MICFRLGPSIGKPITGASCIRLKLDEIWTAAYLSGWLSRLVSFYSLSCLDFVFPAIPKFWESYMVRHPNCCISNVEWLKMTTVISRTNEHRGQLKKLEEATRS